MKNNNRIASIIITVIILGIIFITGCNNENKQVVKTTQKPIIAVSIVPQKTFAQAVCGDLAEVVVMVPPGSSPETYEPTPLEMQKLSNASIYFTIGVAIEKSSILNKASDVKNLKIIKLEDEVSKVYPDRTFEEGERDPHIWLSPKRAKLMVQTMALQMGIIDTKNKEAYEKNAKAYIEKLDNLDSEVKTLLEGAKNKKFIVFHPAFGYFADDYNLKMFALEEEGKEATAAHLRQMIDLAKKEDIKAIFYQEEIDSKQSKAFAEQLGGKTLQLSPLSPDYIENIKIMAQTIKEVAK